MQKIERSARAGFTLIEIMAVVTIIGLLSGLVGLAVVNAIDKGRATSAQTQIDMLVGALEMYRMDNGRFPTTEQGLEALVREPALDPRPLRYPAGGYLRKPELPRDPWGSEYQYEMPGTHNAHSFDLWSLGADGQVGGEGTDADIGNWGAAL